MIKKLTLVFFALFYAHAYAAVFTTEPLSATWKDKLLKSHYWQANCPVPLNRLSLLTISYYDFKGVEHTGNLIVMNAVAPHLLAAFKEIYQNKFPLEQPVAIAEQKSASADLTIAFNCRPITGGSTYSLHAYGTAIDINVVRNPYAGEYKVSSDNKVYGSLIPGANSLTYLNRAIKRPGMNEVIVDIMTRHGFMGW
jgi:hypothetical protein